MRSSSSGSRVTGHERCLFLVLVYLTLTNDQVLQSKLLFSFFLPIFYQFCCKCSKTMTRVSAGTTTGGTTGTTIKNYDEDWCK